MVQGVGALRHCLKVNFLVSISWFPPSQLYYRARPKIPCTVNNFSNQYTENSVTITLINTVLFIVSSESSHKVLYCCIVTSEVYFQPLLLFHYIS
ncbi:hypothetical protein GDO86_014399 [Hymenochirus boettgeri]|uniref:Uncharacterized protein n=1 Tax=Hymenochirus boettgeri TaxID=247094 RepID=A0A8T2JU22_9PIPI|nr:hypothetical protein GDO86_014399 [Hymenochirus boettgeri]